MAKLNKMEISAIADKIIKDVNGSIKSYNEEINSDENYNKWLKKFIKTSEYALIIQTIDIVKEYNTLVKEARKRKRWGGSITIHIDEEDDILKALFSNTIKEKESNITREDLINELILSQAKNEDLDKLIKDLTEKYSA